MNIEKLKILRDRIANAPPEQFIYEEYFDVGDPDGLLCWLDVDWYKNKQAPPCGTAGCVAGHCIMQFGWGAEKNVYDDAQAHLGLSVVEADILFLEAIDRATRRDALRRLDHLIERGTFRGYDFTEEDGYAESPYWYDTADDWIDYRNSDL